MKAKIFDRKFDAGEEVVGQLDLGKARRIGYGSEASERRFPGLDGGVPGPGSAPAGSGATVAYQAVAGRQIG